MTPDTDTDMHPPARKKQRRRVLRFIKINEISGCDVPCQQGADVVLLKRFDPTPTPAEQRASLLARCDRALLKFNPNHDPDDGRFAPAPGGSSTTTTSTSSTSTSTTDDGGAEITREHKQTTLRWARHALWGLKAISWGVTIAAMASAFAVTLPVSGPGVAVAAGLATLISAGSLIRAAAFIALDFTLSKLIEMRERELNKAASSDDPILRTLLAMKRELAALKASEQVQKFNTHHDRRGRFASGPFTSGAGFASGGGSASPASSKPSPAKRSRLRRALQFARAAGGAALDTFRLIERVLGPGVTITLAVAALGAAAGAVERHYKPAPPAKPAQPAHRGVDFWLDKSMPKLTPQQAMLVLARLPDLVTGAQADKIIAALETRRKDKRTMDKRDDDYTATDDFQTLVSAEIGRSSMPRDIAAQRVLQKFGSRPDATSLTKLAKARDDFEECVAAIHARDGGKRTDALAKARREHPREFETYQEG